MTDLTEQWKKGELPSGWYWVDYYSVDGAVMLEYIPQHNGFGYDEKNLVQAVLAEVPDYIDWQNMVNCACEEHKANTKLLEENDELKDTIEALKSELKEVCDVLIRKCPEMKEWVMLNWKNLYEVDNAR